MILFRTTILFLFLLFVRILLWEMTMAKDIINQAFLYKPTTYQLLTPTKLTPKLTLPLQNHQAHFHFIHNGTSAKEAFH